MFFIHYVYNTLPYSGNKEAVQLLIDAGANVNSTTNDGSSPLMFAASAGHTSVVKLLVKHPKIQLHLQVSMTYNVYI